MRKLFVYFLTLGVFTLTAQLVSAELPYWVTTNYPEDEYLSTLRNAGGDSTERIIKDASKELIKGMHKNLKTFFNPRQKQPKNRAVPVAEQAKLERDYAIALTNLQIMRGDQSHIAKRFHQVAIQPTTATSSGGYTLVNVKRQEMMRAYVEQERRLQEQINVMVARATQAEAFNPQRSLEAYLEVLRLYEQLKEAVLIQQAVISPQQQDPAAIYKKLLETATGTNGGALQMPLPEVNKRIHQLQNQGRLINTIDETARSITQQLALQTARLGPQKGRITINGFRYERSNQSIAQSRTFQTMLQQRLERDGWEVFIPEPTPRGWRQKNKWPLPFKANSGKMRMVLEGYSRRQYITWTPGIW